MKGKREICSSCGQPKPLEHKHGFSEALAIGLKRLIEAGKPINIKELGLTRNQWDNFQKLRYWDLVQKSHDSNGKRIGGCWNVTAQGLEFYSGKKSIHRHVYTVMGERTKFSGDLISFVDVHDPYKKRPEYARDAKPAMQQSQGSFF